MLALSQTTGYAILALACMQRRGPELMLARDIAQATGIPLPYLSKILHSLGKSGLIEAKRGYRGGFTLARRPEQISFHDIARAIEGDDYVPQCLLGLGQCLQRPDCPGLTFWQSQRQQVLTYLRQMTLANVPCPSGGGDNNGPDTPQPCLGQIPSQLPQTRCQTRSRGRGKA